MGQIKTVYVPFGDLKPDQKFFGNDGLIEAQNVVPVYGNYIASQFWNHQADIAAEPYGMHVHFAGGTAWYVYIGTAAALVEYNATGWASTTKTRSVGGAYGAGGAGGEAGWQSTSFGDAIIMTDYVDDPQLLTSPATANFAKLALSTFDPKAKFVYVVGQNLYLANLNLSATFDGLPSGANPTVVCWSQSGNERQFGSINATPELIGVGYQPLTYDLGHINGAIGSHDFAVLSLQKGFMRQDGFARNTTFRPIVVGPGCRFPNSMVIYDSDVYMWGPAGPSVLRGGEGPLTVLGRGRVARTLIDNTSNGFSPTHSISNAIEVRHVNAAVDVANGLIYWTFTSTAGTADSRIGNLSIIYNVDEDRFSFADNSSILFSPDVANNGLMFLRSSPDLGGEWSPGRDLVGVLRYIDGSLATIYQVSRPDYGGLPAVLPMLLTKGYQQFDEEYTTRIHNVRPIFSRSAPELNLEITAVINSKNKPYDVAASTNSTAIDGHGRIVTPDSVFADFHQVSLTFDGVNLETLVELEGFEVRVETGGRFAA